VLLPVHGFCCVPRSGDGSAEGSSSDGSSSSDPPPPSGWLGDFIGLAGDVLVPPGSVPWLSGVDFLAGDVPEGVPSYDEPIPQATAACHSATLDTSPSICKIVPILFIVIPPLC
jgi:hypothetical protein